MQSGKLVPLPDLCCSGCKLKKELRGCCNFPLHHAMIGSFVLTLAHTKDIYASTTYYNDNDYDNDERAAALGRNATRFARVSQQR